MPEHLQREIEKLKKQILEVAARAEDAVRQATLSIVDKDAQIARKVIDNDTQLDQNEIEVEEECLKTLALYQPVAIDLRFIVAVLKINNDLERIGDLAVNIAERALFLANRPGVSINLDFASMAGKAQAMVKKSLDALVTVNADMARDVCASDDEIDLMNRKMYEDIQGAIQSHPDQAQSLIHLLSVSRHLERIGDHATNIAEDIIYMIEGVIVRHHAEKYR